MTDRQREILTYLYEHTRDKGYQPTAREMMERFGYTSPNGLWCHIRALVKKGYLGRRAGVHRSRALVILRKPDGSPFTGFAEKTETPGRSVLDLPG